MRSTAFKKTKKKQLHAHCSSHLFITVTVIVTAKTLLAHTVSLPQSHKTCQLRKRRGKSEGGGSRRRLKTAFIARLRAAWLDSHSRSPSCSWSEWLHGRGSGWEKPEWLTLSLDSTSNQRRLQIFSLWWLVVKKIEAGRRIRGKSQSNYVAVCVFPV